MNWGMGKVDSFLKIISLKWFGILRIKYLPIVRAMKPRLPIMSNSLAPRHSLFYSYSRINIPWPYSKANLCYPENNNESRQKLEVWPVTRPLPKAKWSSSFFGSLYSRFESLYKRFEASPGGGTERLGWRWSGIFIIFGVPWICRRGRFRRVWRKRKVRLFWWCPRVLEAYSKKEKLRYY